MGYEEDGQRYVSVAGLRARGWTGAIVHRLLGPPDRLSVDPRRRSAPHTRLYRAERVEAAERSETFRSVADTAARRSDLVRAALERRRQEVLERIRAEPIDVPRLDPGKLALRAMEHRARKEYAALDGDGSMSPGPIAPAPPGPASRPTPGRTGPTAPGRPGLTTHEPTRPTPREPTRPTPPEPRDRPISPEPADRRVSPSPAPGEGVSPTDASIDAPGVRPQLASGGHRASLAPWKVDYLRHRLAHYDRLLDGLPGHGRFSARATAVALLQRRILEAIAEAYPALAEECERQARAQGLHVPPR
ncbi:hypothetical protein ACFWFF_11625 [Streptomyces sp. NPDC060223]|uniref:hypothetical protein n=1 Tax=unclassified Streptomyces TaxID=2593676 RepID=UPI00363E729B